MTRSPARIAVAFGTRPEASKMAPVVRALREHPELEPWVLTTGQHRDQLDAMVRLFGIRVDHALDVMTDRQTLPGLTARIVPAAAEVLAEAAPDFCLVHGDTTTTFAVALAAFYSGVPLGHVEAGLRSFDLARPFPEEGNRRLTDVLTDLDLAPTEGARANLRAEGKPEAGIVVTGNTAVDAVRSVAARARLPRSVSERARGRPLVAITLHRRETLPVLRAVAEAIAELARAHADHLFVWPLHPNPAVRDAVRPAAEGIENVLLDEPWPYEAMAALLAEARLIATDSGGLQEEGAALGVPVAVLRDVTERPEGVDAGVLTLVGTDPDRIRARLDALLRDEGGERSAMRTRPNPYGDGRAGVRIAAAVAWRLGRGPRPDDWDGRAEPS